jgi:GntR family transcriptional repressor for pyruvate dehydrogenase complex
VTAAEPVASGPALFQPIVREPRLSEKVADLILESIISGQLEHGDRLPSERELGERFGVSRTVIREAVRTLAAKGVVEVRPGSGLRVAEVGSSTVRESMTLFLRSSPVLNYDQVNEVRTLLEVEVAGLAAERATAEDIETLTEILRRMETVIDDVEAASIEDVAFHRQIATTTQNELYGLMLDSIGDVLLEIRRSTLAGGTPGPAVLAWHARILDRIAAHDPEGAREAMRDHLAKIEQAWIAREEKAAAQPRPPADDSKT